MIFQSILGKYPGGQQVLLHCARDARELDGEPTIKEQAFLFFERGGTLGRASSCLKVATIIIEPSSSRLVLLWKCTAHTFHSYKHMSAEQRCTDGRGLSGGGGGGSCFT